MGTPKKEKMHYDAGKYYFFDSGIIIPDVTYNS